VGLQQRFNLLHFIQAHAGASPTDYSTILTNLKKDTERRDSSLTARFKQVDRNVLAVSRLPHGNMDSADAPASFFTDSLSPPVVV